MENLPLVLDLIEWLSTSPRNYPEVMDAWRTSCPRLTVWEDATDAGFVELKRHGSEKLVCVTPLGREFLDKHRGGAMA